MSPFGLHLKAENNTNFCPISSDEYAGSQPAIIVA